MYHQGFLLDAAQQKSIALFRRALINYLVDKPARTAVSRKITAPLFLYAETAKNKGPKMNLSCF